MSATETPLKRVAYYKGCLASLSAKELDTSTQALAPQVGIELVELESVTCCGAGDIHEAEPDYYLHLNARILAYAEATGADMLLTVCNVCTLNLRQANYMLQGDSDLLARVNENLETVGVPPYSGNVEVRHLLWEIAEGDGYERLKEVAHRGLKGLKVAPFYGCQILRPSKIMGFEDPDRPWSLERIIEACGGEAIDYPAKIKCCGFPIIQAREETAMGELIQPIEQALEAGADVMVTPCPLCHLSLDAWQSKLEASTGREFQLPILHLAQLVGVAAGLEESELKFKRHIVDPRPALERLRSLKPFGASLSRPALAGACSKPAGCGGGCSSSNCQACRPSLTACGSRTSRTFTSASPRRESARPGRRPSGCKSASRTSSRSAAICSRIRAASRCFAGSCGSCRGRCSPCWAITTSRSVAIRRRVAPTCASSSPRRCCATRVG